MPALPSDHLLGFLHWYRTAQSACISNKYHLLATNWPIILCFHFLSFKSVRLAATYLSNTQGCLDFSTLYKKSVFHKTLSNRTERRGAGTGNEGHPKSCHQCISAALICARCFPVCMKGHSAASAWPVCFFFLNWFFWPLNLQRKMTVWQNRAPVFRNVHYAATMEGGRSLFRQLHCFPVWQWVWILLLVWDVTQFGTKSIHC